MTIEEALDWANNHRGNPWSKNTSMIAMWTLADEVRRLEDEI